RATRRRSPGSTRCGPASSRPPSMAASSITCSTGTDKSGCGPRPSRRSASARATPSDCALPPRTPAPSPTPDAGAAGPARPATENTLPGGPQHMANLSTGITHTATYAVDRRLTVPELFPEDPNTSRMPEVLATGFLVALMERACVEAMAPHLAEGEASLGIGVE